MSFDSAGFDASYRDKKKTFEDYLREEWGQYRSLLSQNPHTEFGHQKILQCVEYSLMGEGKRFRPVLALAMAEAAQGSFENVLPWAMAIEMIHTYSLIHDDLPCMDNDDFRRGRPTNHKVFGETTALLAGDALLTEAFGQVTKAPAPFVRKLVALMNEAAGLRGMLMGQCLDLAFAEQGLRSQKQLSQVHDLKTAKLIQASAQGAALISEASESYAAQYGFHLGMSFQIADDLLDQHEGESQNSVALVGQCATQDLLEYHVDQAMQAAAKFSRPDFLQNLAVYNLHRKQ